ncbi:MAG: preprotein translocase subunit SecE [Flavobacteriaceae bacterium]|nr:preprotein translocase subunit SecE [Flavobacteriaceae bacterium]
MKLLKYIKESFEELRTNITWASKEEVNKSTVVVAVFTVIFALSVFLVDSFFQMGLDSFFKQFN